MKTPRLLCVSLPGLFALLLAWSGAHGQPAMKGKAGRPPGIRALAFSADGKLLASVSGEPDEQGEAILWDLATHKPRFVHREAVGTPSVAFSPDGKTLAVGTFTDNARLLDVATGKLLRSLPGHGKGARGVAFSPDGKTLAVSSYDGSVRLWDLDAAKVRHTIMAHQNWVYAVAFSPDGKRLASSSADNTMKLWDGETGQALQTHQHGSIVRRVAFTRDGRWLFCPSWDGLVRIRDAKTGELRASMSGTEGAACTANGQLWAVCGQERTVRIHRIRLAESSAAELERIRGLIRKLDEEEFAAREEASRELRTFGMAAEPELRKALKESPSAEVRMRARRLRKEVRTPEPLAVLRGHSSEVEVVEFSPDDRLLASGGTDGAVRLWDTATWKEIATLTLPR